MGDFIESLQQDSKAQKAQVQPSNPYLGLGGLGIPYEREVLREIKLALCRIEAQVEATNKPLCYGFVAMACLLGALIIVLAIKAAQ